MDGGQLGATEAEVACERAVKTAVGNNDLDFTWASTEPISGGYRVEGIARASADRAHGYTCEATGKSGSAAARIISVT